MKFYSAARFGEKEVVRQIYGLLQRLGHEVTADWTAHIPVSPYDKNVELVTSYASKDMKGVLDSEVFVT